MQLPEVVEVVEVGPRDGLQNEAAMVQTEGKQTDAMVQPLIDAIGEDFEPLVTQLNEWGDLCIKAGAFPPSIQKRAAR